MKLRRGLYLELPIIYTTCLPFLRQQVLSRSARKRRTSSVEIDEKEAARLHQAEVRRHQKLFSLGHKCTRVFIKWLPERISGMVANSTISAADIKDINISELLVCPFCAILGERTISKVPEKRKKSEAVPLTTAEDPCDTDESDFDYNPSYAEASSNASSPSNDSFHTESDCSSECAGYDLQYSDNED